MNLAQLRADTPGCAHRLHLNNAGASPSPQSVLNAVKQHLDLEAQIGGYEAARAREPQIEEAYQHLAALLNTKPSQVAITASATDSYARVLAAFDWQPGDVILTTNNDYVSNQLAFLSLQKRRGVRLLRAADQPTGGVDVDHLCQLARQHRPRLVAVTHVPTNSGLVQPVEAVGQVCRELDVWYLVDGCQSWGQLPLDLAALGCDFFSATGRKFLRGPRGTGVLYLSERVLAQGLAPLLIDLRGSQWTAPDEFVNLDNARRFELWEFAYGLVLGLGEAAAYAQRVGLPAIAERNAALCAQLRAGLAALPGVRLLDEGTHLASLVTCHLAGADGAALSQHLSARNLNHTLASVGAAVIDFTRKNVPWALRFSPHYFNTEAEMEAAISAVAEFGRRSV